MVLERFHSELRVSLDGSVEVTESLRVRFSGEWEGIYRDLSLEHRTAQGRSERLKVEVMDVTGGKGEALRFEDWRQDGWTDRIQVWVPDARDATRTVVLRYRLTNLIRFFDEGSEAGALDEVYWNVTGNRWDVPMEESGARIVLPEGVLPTRWAAYTGPAGSTGSDVEIEVAGSTVSFQTTRVLDPWEGLTVAVGWDPGAVARPQPPSKFRRVARRGWPMVLPLLTFFLSFGWRRKKGRDPGRRPVTVQYEPPENLSPTEAGTLVDRKVHKRDIAALLVDLAVRGYILIEARAVRTLGFFTRTKYFFHLRKPQEEWGILRPHERRFLEALFRQARFHADGRSLEASYPRSRVPPDGGDEVGRGPTFRSVPLKSLAGRFYAELPEIEEAVYHRLVSGGYYEGHPGEARSRWSAVGTVIMVLGLVAALFGQFGLAPGLASLVLGAALVLSGLIVRLFGRIMHARTPEGARAMEWALGFKEFLGKVEEDRFRRMITSPEMFERFLPYAMAFRVEGRWARAFEGMFFEPPPWYSGAGREAFRTSVFARDLGRMSSRAGGAMSSKPFGSSHSSRGWSSSGSGGGGRSGGGSGGGGGGGF